MDRQQIQSHLQVPELQPQVAELSVNQEPSESTKRFNIEYAELLHSKILGCGRFGRVYQHQYNGTTVAVKDIAVSAKDQPRLERLLREGKIHMELFHRNIIALFDSNLLQQHLLLVMEFAAGGSLSDVLKDQTRLEPSVVTNCAGQICDGMRYLHEKHIVHRDLKSSNILVLEPIDNSGLLGKTMKIADFGLACDGHDETRTMSEVGGTKFWMAPEVLESPHRFSKASDVYSFGMVVWNLLTGNEPSREVAKGFQVKKNLPMISPFYDGLLKKCCTSDHLKRPTFTNILADITQWKRRNATESEGISWCNEELDSVVVNFHASLSLAPAPSLQQPSQQQQQASPSRAPSPSQLNMQHSQQRQQQASSSPPTQQQQQQSFSFGAASDRFKLPVFCQDVALTQDGRSLLLAARQHGLIELSAASGRELRRWLPPKLSSIIVNYKSDLVLTVAALCDQRAAVSLFHAQLVVLLRRNERRGSSSTGRAAATVAAAAAAVVAAVASAIREMTASWDDAWTEDRRIQLPWSAGCLSAHGDLLAASESLYQHLESAAWPAAWSESLGQGLQLLSLSSGRRLSDTELQHDYCIGSLAVTARQLFTGSYYKVELGGGRRAHVLDAHSLDADGGSDKRLWRHVLQLEERLQGVCADSSGGCLYAAVNSSDMRSDRVSALSLADGSELRRVALSFHSAAAAPQLLLLPMRLSLCDDGAADQQRSSSRRSDGRVLLLAALCEDLETYEWRTVTLHRSTSDMLQ